VVVPRAIRGLKPDLVAEDEILQDAELGVPMAAEDRVAPRAGRRTSRYETGPERHRSPARVGQDDEIDAMAGQREASDRPGIGPWPGLNRAAPVLGGGPGVVEQALGEPCLRVDPTTRGAEADRQRDQPDEEEPSAAPAHLAPLTAKAERASGSARVRAARPSIR